MPCVACFFARFPAGHGNPFAAVSGLSASCPASFRQRRKPCRRRRAYTLPALMPCVACCFARLPVGHENPFAAVPGLSVSCPPSFGQGRNPCRRRRAHTLPVLMPWVSFVFRGLLSGKSLPGMWLSARIYCIAQRLDRLPAFVMGAVWLCFPLPRSFPARGTLSGTPLRHPFPTHGFPPVSRRGLRHRLVTGQFLRGCPCASARPLSLPYSTFPRVGRRPQNLRPAPE